MMIEALMYGFKPRPTTLKRARPPPREEVKEAEEGVVLEEVREGCRVGAWHWHMAQQAEDNEHGGDEEELASDLGGSERVH